MRLNQKSIVKAFIFALLISFMLMNTVAIFHAYKFTHFSSHEIEKTKDSGQLTALQKGSILLFGISNPRPKNRNLPATQFETLSLKSNKLIECWYINAASPRGTVILFHGFSGQKSSLIEKAGLFREQGYNTLLVDFMGSGGSEGNQTTIGFKEAEQVKTCFDFIKNKGEKRIFLFGTSMGAVAIMKAIKETRIKPQGVILECPFGSMYKTVCARFKTMRVPEFPMAGLLVFWGGILNGFWAFGHNPIAYAKDISSPVLLMYGLRDEKVSKVETDEIFANLKGQKKLVIYNYAGHENYLLNYNEQWLCAASEFIRTH